MRVAVRVDVGVDADRHASHAPLARGDRLDPIELARRFDVDRLEAERHSAVELRSRFPDARKHNVRGLKPGLAGELNFPDRICVGRASELAHQPRDRERRVRLEGVMERVRIAAERGVDGAIPRSERRGAVNVHRRAFRRRDRGQRNAVADEFVMQLRVAREADHNGVSYTNALSPSCLEETCRPLHHLRETRSKR